MDTATVKAIQALIDDYKSRKMSYCYTDREYYCEEGKLLAFEDVINDLESLILSHYNNVSSGL